MSSTTNARSSQHQNSRVISHGHLAQQYQPSRVQQSSRQSSRQHPSRVQQSSRQQQSRQRQTTGAAAPSQSRSANTRDTPPAACEFRLIPFEQAKQLYLVFFVKLYVYLRTVDDLIYKRTNTNMLFKAVTHLLSDLSFYAWIMPSEKQMANILQHLIEAAVDDSDGHVGYLMDVFKGNLFQQTAKRNETFCISNNKRH